MSVLTSKYDVVILTYNKTFDVSTKKFLSQGFIETRLRSTIQKYFGRYHNLTLPYRVSVTMANDICRP